MTDDQWPKTHSRFLRCHVRSKKQRTFCFAISSSVSINFTYIDNSFQISSRNNTASKNISNVCSNSDTKWVKIFFHKGPWSHNKCSTLRTLLAVQTISYRDIGRRLVVASPRITYSEYAPGTSYRGTGTSWYRNSQNPKPLRPPKSARESRVARGPRHTPYYTPHR